MKSIKASVRQIMFEQKWRYYCEEFIANKLAVSMQGDFVDFL